jgi:hypothetical protein
MLVTVNTFGNDTLIRSSYITVYPTPPVPILTQNGNLLTSSPADFYQWQFNTVDIPGATNQSYTVSQSGYHTIIVTDTNGCFASATMYVDVTGIGDLIYDSNFSVYPNPSAGKFIIEVIPSHLQVSESLIKITNTVGQVVFSENGNRLSINGKMEVDLTDQDNGIYFVEIRTNQFTMLQKIIISDF